MTRIVLSILLAATLLPAQTKVRRLIEFKHLNADMSERVRVLASKTFPNADFYGDATLRATVVRANTEPELDEAEKFMRGFDRPRIDPANQVNNRPSLTFWILAASLPSAKEAGPPPAELASVIAQMKKTFTYPDFALLDTQIADGDTEVNGVMPLPGTNPTLYTLKVFNSVQSGDLSQAGLELVVRVPAVNSNQYTTLNLRTQLHIKQGRKVVIGKMRIDQSPGAVFLVAALQ